MARLEEFLDPLFQGVQEVVVPKTLVTEPLDAGWKGSRINVPSPRMLTSYRKGRFHVHVYEEDYRVHLDRYDPERSPLLHLLSDAPLLLMIWGTVSSLTVEASDAAKGSAANRLANLRLTSWTRMALGATMVLVGALLSFNPSFLAHLIFQFIVPVALIWMGLIMLFQSRGLRSAGKAALGSAITGTLVVTIGIVMFFLWRSEMLLILLALAAWFLSSAILSLWEARRRADSSMGGALGALAIGLLSFVLGVATFFVPRGVIGVLMVTLGAIAVLMGVLFLVDGYCLRGISKEMGRASPTG